MQRPQIGHEFLEVLRIGGEAANKVVTEGRRDLAAIGGSRVESERVGRREGVAGGIL